MILPLSVTSTFFFILNVRKIRPTSVDRVPITCYPLRKVNTYWNSNLTSYAGYIALGDKCKLLSVNSNGTVYVEYPISGNRTKRAYCDSSAFFVNPNFSTTQKKMGGNYTVYTTAYSSTKLGAVYSTDRTSITGVLNGRTQILYPIQGGYKLGFINGVINTGGNSQPISASAFQWPLTNYYVCGNDWSTYYRAKNGDHLGLDIKSKTGDTNVYAFANGTVTQSGYNSANGNCVVIKHTISGKTVYSFYGHLKSRTVYVGQKVSKGSKIGVIGNTGSSSTGVHLHFAISTQNSCGTWGYTQNSTFSNNANSVSWKGYTYYNPYYVIKNGKLP
jgi:murein DD-endopeptidase MepM/ murein hydrolase activator NlpD